MSRKYYSVAECATVLDELAPKDWAKRINTNILNLHSYNTCIIGQIFDGTKTNRASDFCNKHFALDTQSMFFCNNEFRHRWIEEINARLNTISVSVDSINVTIGQNKFNLTQEEAKKLVDLLTKFIA